jgi:hemin uptake protein HemP
LRINLRANANSSHLELSMSSSQRPEQPEEEADKATPLTISSDTLLAGRRQLIIQHGGEQYRLLLTRSNKLILTK